MATHGTSAKAPLHYRPDLDGLRSLAILPVVLYHYGATALRGGFVGVDVFFVLSGFLITSLLLRDIDAGRFSIVDFYERRARRILPALFFVAAVTTGLALLVFLPLDLANYGKSLAATTAFASNIFFWREFGYFDRAAEFKPLLHTWSLSVEEQFYILFPPFLWLISRAAKKYVAPILTACLCLSLALSVIAAARWPAAAFYLPVTRAWELLIGALLAAGAIARVTSPRVRHALSILGIALIAGSVALIDRTMAFPGWLAAVPCLGAALIIHASLSGGGVGNRFLQWKPLVGLGLVSYSLYLWHWPLLVLAKYAANRELSIVELAIVLLAALGLSIASWRFVERPFRGHHGAFSRRRVFQLAAACSAVALAIGSGFILSGGWPSRIPGNVLRYAQMAVDDLPPGCFNGSADDVRSGRLCRIGAPLDAPPSFIVWGDSHAWRISTPLAEIARSSDRVGLLASVGSCPPLADVQWPLRGCAAFNDEVLKLVEHTSIDTVVLAAEWADYAEGTHFNLARSEGDGNVLSDAMSASRTVEDNPVVFGRSLRRTVERLSHAGLRVVVIGPVPEIGVPVPETLARAEWFGGTRSIGPSLAQFRHRQRHVFDVLEAVERVPNTSVIYPSTVSCSPDCAVERLGEVLYIDDNHLSRAGLNLLKPVLGHVFDHSQKVAVGQTSSSSFASRSDGTP